MSHRESARIKAAERAAAERKRRKRRLIWTTTGAAVAALAIGTGITVAAVASGTTTAPRATASAPPWPAPADPESRAKQAGLEVATMEGDVLHIHQHLSISIDGSAVTVPANLGVDPLQGTMSALHTHDTSGIIHVESATQRPFTLGQLFTEWGVRLKAHTIGPYVDGAGDRRVTLFVDGKRSDTPLPALRLADRQDIDIVVTSHGQEATSPAPFDWAAAG